MNRRALIAIVDVPSQAYGRREETLGIQQCGERETSEARAGLPEKFAARPRAKIWNNSALVHSAKNNVGVWTRRGWKDFIMR